MFRCLLFTFLFCSFFACNQNSNPIKVPNAMKADFDWQGHRGARGLLPENTVPAFLKALEFSSITTLELDVAISKDSQIILSHEPWMSANICTKPDGNPVEELEEEQLLLYQMTYEEIKSYDCGSRGNARFPNQLPIKIYKPALKEMVQEVEQLIATKQKSPIHYNIEIKSRPEWDGVKTPDPNTFAQLLIEEIIRLQIKDRTCIQSFDKRALQAVQHIDSTIVTALLIENTRGVTANLEELGYIPEIYSPYYRLLTANVVDVIHEKGMKVIPWTVNDTNTMNALIQIGVDGIITDYPDRIPSK